jgi:hypothetical protein
MDAVRRHLGRLHGVAFVAILSLALAPTLSRAIAHMQGDASWGAVCTSSASSLPAATEAPASLPGAAHLDHCPLCAVGAQPFAPPVAARPLVVDDVVSQALPRLRPEHAAARAWFVARPRGPPSAHA